MIDLVQQLLTTEPSRPAIVTLHGHARAVSVGDALGFVNACAVLDLRRSDAYRESVWQSGLADIVRLGPHERPIPHLRFGRYVRLSWGSESLREWLGRQLVSTNGQVIRRK